MVVDNVSKLLMIPVQRKGNQDAQRDHETGPTGGCGRAYVKVHGLTPAGYRAVAAACATVKATMNYGGPVWIKEMKAIYVGYDNATGAALAKAKAVADALKAAGWGAYDDAESD